MCVCVCVCVNRWVARAWENKCCGSYENWVSMLRPFAHHAHKIRNSNIQRQTAHKQTACGPFTYKNIQHLLAISRNCGHLDQWALIVCCLVSNSKRILSTLKIGVICFHPNCGCHPNLGFLLETLNLCHRILAIHDLCYLYAILRSTILW